MTCIAALVHKGTVYMGGDSAGVGSWSLTVRADEKVFKRGPFLMGFTTSFRMGQLLRYSLDAPKQKDGQDTYAFMVTDFIDAVRKCLKDGGYAKKDNEVESGGTFLVGYRGRIFKVDSDYQVGEAADGFDAAGCGCEIASGALYATSRQAPRRRIETALAAAERLCAGVRGPFTVLKLKANGNGRQR